tara:strand:- start:7552 stop:7752 length:201 start_codon:yes stop_codon:yes gene_type:complete
VKTFKRITNSDAMKAYGTYLEKGKPQQGAAFEVLMARVMVSRINNKAGKLIALTESEFEAYQFLIE